MCQIFYWIAEIVSAEEKESHADMELYFII